MSEAKKNGVEELQVITPPTMLLELRADTVTIHRMKTKQLLQIMEIAAPFYDELQEMKKEVTSSVKRGQTPNVDIPIYSIIMKYGSNIVQLLSVLTDKDEEWVGELEVDELVLVFSTVLEVNIDFFTQRVLPLLNKLIVDLRGVAKQTPGQTSSKV